MKSKIIILLLIIISTIQMAFAQDEVGVKGGVSFSSFIHNEIEDKNMRIGWHAGLYSKSSLGANVYVQPELLFSTKGTSMEYDIAGSQGQTDANLYYIDLPILLGVSLTDQLSVQIGPYISYLLDVSITSEGDFGSDHTDVDRDHLNSFDFGLVGGLEYDLGMIGVGARYNYGITNIEDSDAAEFLIGKSQNSVGQLYLSFKFSE
ncbi:porin family protein [Reichenbachiella sp.]|uniref:porin family protein n=1 Tax=Reichenbachiella sp. TaxID=2184521 RepID=UPI003BB208F4